MKVADFFKWAKSMQEEENRLMEVKGEEYTVSNEDKFKNFKSVKTHGFNKKLCTNRE